MDANDGLVSALNKIGNVLAHLLLNGMGESDQATKIKILRGCGFSNGEIAEMLHTTPLNVQVTFSKVKKKKGKRA